MLWGIKTLSAFDVWSFEHFLSGISIGYLALKINQHMFKKWFKLDIEKLGIKYFDIIFVLFAAYFWETIEHYLELGLAGPQVEYWFQGVEYWPNRLITDPLLLIAGYYFAIKNPKLVPAARILSLIWLLIHIIIFEHSMVLHYIF